MISERWGCNPTGLVPLQEEEETPGCVHTGKRPHEDTASWWLSIS